MRNTKVLCARCLIPKPAETKGRFAYENYEYEIDLCDLHARMFDADLSNWIRLAKDIGPVVREHVENVVVPFPIVDGGVDDQDGPSEQPEEEISLDAMSYTFTEHAVFRMNHRKVTKTEVFRVISTKNKTVRPSEDNFGAFVYTTDDLKVVVNPTRKRVITVAWRHEDMDTKEMQASGT